MLGRILHGTSCDICNQMVCFQKTEGCKCLSRQFGLFSVWLPKHSIKGAPESFSARLRTTCPKLLSSVANPTLMEFDHDGLLLRDAPTMRGYLEKVGCPSQFSREMFPQKHDQYCHV